MEYKIFKDGFGDIKTSNRQLVYIAAFLAISNLILTVSWITKDEIVRMMPPTLAGTPWISMEDASDEYKMSYALMVAGIMGNVTPNTADDVRKNIRGLFDPRAYEDISAAVDSQVRLIEKESLVIRFTPAKRFYEEESNKIFITGQSLTYGPSGDKKLFHKTLEFIVGIELGMPKIMFFDTYEGRPRTLELLKRQAR